MALSANGTIQNVEHLLTYEKYSEPFRANSTMSSSAKRKADGISAGADVDDDTHKMEAIPVEGGGADDSGGSGLIENQRRERQRNVQLLDELIEHAIRCNAQSCSQKHCVKMKHFLMHSQHCKIKASGGCKNCKHLRMLLRIHASHCKLQDCPMPCCNTHGWADLQDDLVRGIGAFHDEPRDLAAMERTCRSWRKIVIDGNGDMKISDTSNGNEEKVSLWRDLALTKVPALPSIVKALQDKEHLRGGSLNNDDGIRDLTNYPTFSRPPPKWALSWKNMFRSQHCVATKPMYYSPAYSPKTSVNDYILSYEFRRFSTKELLFVTSGGIDKESPQLWNQDIVLGHDGEFPKLKGPVDPKLVARLGDDPFTKTKVRDIGVRVVVTRITDMKAVELSSSLCLTIYPSMVVGDVDYHDRKCFLTFASEHCHPDDVPDDEGPVAISKYSFAPNLHRNDAKLTLFLKFCCNTGCIRFLVDYHTVDIVEEDGDTEYQLESCQPREILEYLETRCPFGKTCRRF